MKARQISIALAALCLLLLQACDGERQAAENPEEKTAMATVQVEAFYRERMLLPPQAEIYIALEDVAKILESRHS